MLTDLEDHAVGVELQIIELVEQRERARVQGRVADAADFDRQINELQADLTFTAECAASDSFGTPRVKAREADFA